MHELIQFWVKPESKNVLESQILHTELLLQLIQFNMFGDPALHFVHILVVILPQLGYLAYVIQFSKQL